MQRARRWAMRCAPSNVIIGALLPHRHSSMTLIRESFPVGRLQCNCTVLGDAETGRGKAFADQGH